MKVFEIVLIAAAVVIVAGVIAWSIYCKKKGKSSCCSDCSSCPYCKGCKKTDDTETKKAK